MTPKDLTTLLYETGTNHVATITINRPEALNSFSLKMTEEFEWLWRHIRDDESVHAVVLRAAPGRAFSTGLDLKGPSITTLTSNPWNQIDPGERLGPKTLHCWKPVIVAVHGMCAGGAFYWINEADIVICSDDATFFDPHVTFGRVAAVEPIGLSYKIGFQEVMRMALLGNDERIGAQTALRIGLVTEITTLEGLWPRAAELAAVIASRPTVAIQGSVRALWESLDLSRRAAIQRALSYTQVGNAAGKAQVDQAATLKSSGKTYTIR
jgi:enoyl-CoA hydratase/carnithine racemase